MLQDMLLSGGEYYSGKSSVGSLVCGNMMSVIDKEEMT